MAKYQIALFLILFAVSTGCIEKKKSKAFLTITMDSAMTKSEKQFDIALEKFTQELRLPSIKKGLILLNTDFG